MKVLLINKFYYLKGGSERVLFDTKNILEKNGHTVVVFSMQDQRNEPCLQEKFFVPAVDFNSFAGRLKSFSLLYSWSTAKRLEALIKKEKPDIAHLHNAYYQISPSIFAVLKKYKIPVVLTAHDYHLICPNYRLYTQGAVCERCKKYKYYNAVRYRCLDNSLGKSVFAGLAMTFNKINQFYEKGVAKIICPSVFMAEKLKSWGWPDKKTTVLPYAVDTQIFHQQDKVKKDGLLYFGRFSSEKGLPTLLAALEQLPDVKIKLVGDGPLKPAIIKQAQKNKNIEILPYFSLTQVFKLVDIINKAQAVIVPSVWYENYPMAILESLACGTPVIGSNIGGIPELVQDNKTGFVFEAGNSADLAFKIKKLYNNNRLVRQFGQNAVSWVNHNNSPQMYYQKLLDIYHENAN